MSNVYYAIYVKEVLVSLYRMTPTERLVAGLPIDLTWFKKVECCEHRVPNHNTCSDVVFEIIHRADNPVLSVLIETLMIKEEAVDVEPLPKKERKKRVILTNKQKEQILAVKGEDLNMRNLSLKYQVSRRTIEKLFAKRGTVV